MLIDQNQYLNYVNSFMNYNDLVVENSQDKTNEEEFNAINTKVNKFCGITTIKEAKALAKELFGIQNEISYIKAGKAQCTIISRSNVFRIILDSDKELKCINIKKQQNEEI